MTYPEVTSHNNSYIYNIVLIITGFTQTHVPACKSFLCVGINKQVTEQNIL